MAIDPGRVLAASLDEISFSYSESEAVLYALGVGFGARPTDARELAFLSDECPLTVPTMACALAWRTDLAKRTGLDMQQVLHGEQRLTLLKPLPSAGRLLVSERVIDVFDKGVGRGAVLLQEKLLREANGGAVIARALATVIARGYGGFGGRREGAPAPHVLPVRPADMVVLHSTRPEQALLYALTGDRNPIHRDPGFARGAGFPRPILHGLCTYGMACKAVILSCCDGDASRISAFDGRFTAVVYPGETLLIELWQDGVVVSFRVRVAERPVVALDNGHCVLGFNGNSEISVTK